ncbi:MAG: hypothetical protein MR286_08385 [Clostridiales bacterium]|nr:hypothetical protein [Clostridiales bacterium]
MAKKRKWGRLLAFGAAAAALGGMAAYQHRKEIERTLQEIADQMDAWEESDDFFNDQEAVVHVTDPVPPQEAAPQEAAPQEEAPEETAAEEDAPTERDFADVPPEEPAASQSEQPEP